MSKVTCTIVGQMEGVYTIPNRNDYQESKSIRIAVHRWWHTAGYRNKLLPFENDLTPRAMQKTAWPFQTSSSPPPFRCILGSSSLWSRAVEVASCGSGPFTLWGGASIVRSITPGPRSAYSSPAAEKHTKFPI